MIAALCYESDAGLHIASDIASPSWPLIGLVGPVIYAFDGRRLWLTHVAFNRLQRAARARSA